MKFRKILVSVLLVVAMLTSMLSLFSCGGNKVAPEFKMPENGFDISKKVTITFYHTMGANLREVLDAYIVEFNKLYPNIKIEHKQVGGYDDVRKTISTEITVGDQPNIAYCYPDHVALYNMSKAVQTLDVLMNSDKTVKDALGNETIIGLTQEQKDDFIKGYYEEGMQYGDGKMYTLPLSKSTEVLYYNKTFFDEHNLQVPKTWDELEALCAKIKEIDPDCIPLGYDSEANWFITMCEQLGSDYTTANGDNNFIFNNETNRNFVKRFREWYKLGYVTTQEIHGAYTSSLFTMAATEKGNSYMSIGSSAGATHQRPAKVNGAYPFEVGIATVPQMDANNPKVISQGPSLCIFKKSNPQEVLASWLFVKYLTTKVEFQAEFSMASGYIPVIKSVKENPIYADYLNKADGGDFITTLSVKVGLEQENAYYTSPAFNGSSVARDQVGYLIQRCFVATWKDSEVDAKIKAEFDKAVKECKYQIGK
ncbi:MAG: extracellular solute-binding protein [Clostridia bacterium]|nr:extracellular solute-binding protein [Clostridia bacterium]